MSRRHRRTWSLLSSALVAVVASAAILGAYTAPQPPSEDPIHGRLNWHPATPAESLHHDVRLAWEIDQARGGQR